MGAVSGLASAYVAENRATPLHGTSAPLHGATTPLHGASAPLHGAATPLHGTSMAKGLGLPDTVPVAAAHLLERQVQVGELARLLHEAGTSAGKLAFVSGEAGAGKSALIEEFTQRKVRSARLLWGNCDALQTSRVLGPVNEVAAGLSLLPDEKRESDLSRELLFSRLLERLSPPNPLSIVVLEDVHWADEATLDFVLFIGRRIQRTRCLLIVSYRDDELSPSHLLRGVLGDLTGQHTARVQVPALSLNAVEQLARGTQRNARTVYQVTGGNPFFVREMLSAPMDTVPATVRDAVLARLIQCSAAARELAEFVSLMPGRTETCCGTTAGRLCFATNWGDWLWRAQYPMHDPKNFIKVSCGTSSSTARMSRNSCTMPHARKM